MKRQILIALLVLLFGHTLASATIWHVPSRIHHTIQDAINDAVNGDVVIVEEGTYTGHGNVDLDFRDPATGIGKSITLKSTINLDNPNWDTIAKTIIDCRGNKRDPHRAFHFHSGEGPDTRVLGFTIINGYQRGPIGADGAPWTGLAPFVFNIYDNDIYGPYANSGKHAFGNGDGGAILCQTASPTIKYCVIRNCTVTGAQGGDGAGGMDGEWCYTDPTDPNNIMCFNSGQWGGNGGNGTGEGHGGAIACLSSSNPNISNCIIRDNFARGGCGGGGGNGGRGRSSSDDAGVGGDGGRSIGDGQGGGIYADGSSRPTITNCQLINDVATTGFRSNGGLKGTQGNTVVIEIDDEDEPFSDGADGLVFSTGGIAGGAGYFTSNGHPDFNDCNFIGNKAYYAYFWYDPFLGEDIWAYTVGGALYSGPSTIVTLLNCRFTGNLGGAVYCDSWAGLAFDACAFNGNSDTQNGGAVYIATGCSTDLRNCSFSGNSAYNDGGAIQSESGLHLTNCSFGSNTALGGGGQFTGYGGAVDLYLPGSTLTIHANNCTFFRNQAVSGAGFSSEDFSATFTDCYFIDNTAENGGALDLMYGDVTVTGGTISGNNAAEQGGGIYCRASAAVIENCTIENNSADGPDGFGGAIYFYASAAQKVFNCLLNGNSAAIDGGAIYSFNADPQIGNCTFSNNHAAGFGGAIFANWGSDPTITDSIFHNCSGHAIHEDDGGGNATAQFCLFYDNADGDYYDSGTKQTYTNLDPYYNIHTIPGGNYNIYGDPLFEGGPLGGFYLNQDDSNAVDTGSASSASLGLDTYTTDPNNIPDSNRVDRGYHYLNSSDPNVCFKFQLTARVSGGNGTVEPTAPQPFDYNSVSDVYTYYAGTNVTLTATPDAGWRVKAWEGTDNDSSTERTNTVVMNYDRTVTVEFGRPRILEVAVGGGDPGYYSNIQDAVHDAVDGDTIIVYPGTYYGGYWGIIVEIDKSIEIKSQRPDDPQIVAATIIDGYRQSPFNEGFINMGVRFLYNTDANTILNGFTIQNCGGRLNSGLPGDRPDGHPDGYDGVSGGGGAIQIEQGAAPVIKNCIIKDNVMISGNGGIGENATTTENAGRGGWSGWIRGGAIYCAAETSPTFINCQIINNLAQGGNGGDGGNGTPTDGIGNYGGNWSRAEAWDINPFNLFVTFEWGDLWQVWGYIGDYRWYSAYGGGAYCGANSTVTFTDCNITENRTVGGETGQGGIITVARFNEPLIPFEILTFGGGVYCAAGSTVTFDGCTLADNIASDPNFNNHHRDPYLGHGGGVCAEDTAVVTFSNCNVSGNQACVGGGVHLANSNPVIDDCNFVSNSAYQGGAVFAEHGPVDINGCGIYNNEAILRVPVEPNDPNVTVYANGGGLFLLAADANVSDCHISGNMASSSGGGVYFGGKNNARLVNCLITDNMAARDGGGVSTNIFAQLTVSNCTIVGNIVTADGFGTGFGGGLSCSYETTTDIINSILWNNKCINGAQLAVGTGFEHDLGYSTINVSFSDIGPPYDPCNPFDFNMVDVSGFVGEAGESGTGSKLVDANTIYSRFNAEQDKVKVIVSLFEPVELREQTDWSEPTSVFALRAEIDNRQSTVLSSLAPAEFSLRYRFENQAGFSGEVSVGGIDRLLSDPLVQYIEPVRKVKPMLAQGIPLMNADAYRSNYNGRGIAIAICDTGVDYRHQMLGGGGFPNSKVIGGYDFGDDDFNPIPDVTLPASAHGTCCAGIAAGDLGTVGDYIGGVAYNAKIYAVKMSPDGSDSADTDAMIASWDWCVTHQDANADNPIMVISTSFAIYGLPFDNPDMADAYSPGMTAAAGNAAKNGITVLAASGNDGFTDGIAWPAAISSVISVGAVHDINDTVMDYSNTAEILDILAPSEDAYTTDIIGAAGYDPCDYYPYFGGTSAACPYAAGAVAALQSAAFDMAGVYLTPVQVRYLLTETGVPITDTKVLITKPRVNLGATILNLPSSPVHVEQNCTLNGWDFDPYTGIWDPNYYDFGNVSDDPNFIAGYLLEQVAAGQEANSVCVDAGSDLASVLGMDIYTTRTDSVFDSGIVDMGFHYPPFIVTQYLLTVAALEVDGFTPDINEPDPNVGFHDWYRRIPLEVNAAPNDYQVVWIGTDDDSVTGRYNVVTMDSDKVVLVAFGSNICDLTVEVIGNGSVFPMSGTYDRDTVVDLIATPDQGYRIRSWSGGTDDDTSTARTNTVTMDGDKIVTVEFEQTRTISVPGEYSSIQQAFEAAGEGDTILVATGVWDTSTGYFIHDKPVIITSTAPDDPCVVANTVIEMQSTDVGGWVSTAFTFYNVGPEAVLNGITIRGFQMGGVDGEDAEEAGESGENGASVAGGAITCLMASPTIKNCIIEDCNITGGDGGDGYNGADPNIHGGHGGWPGFAFGGGLACLLESSPIVTNCTFRNCGATGGNGGDGGNGNSDPDGFGGRGGGWYYGSDSFWYGVPWPYAYHIDGSPYDGEYDFYTRYSGKGGAVYVGPDCAPVFDHCTFINNSSYSGNCGICGQDAGDEGRGKPGQPWVIENSGGAVYCDSGSWPIFTDCVFSYNTADINDPNYNDDPYVSLGGAVAFEDGSMPVFENCTFNNNLATIGGAVYSGGADPRISGSDFVRNVAYHGAGLYCADSDVAIENCWIVDNTASVWAINAPNDMNNSEILGQGGGIYCGSSSGRIAGCNISGNEADASGGGIYLAGEGLSLFNCLVTGNQAGRDGGGVSANWACTLTVANCTIVDNTVAGTAFTGSYGGGLYCSYGSAADIINSIIWDNFGTFGSQLAVATGFEFDPRPSTVNISYSDVGCGVHYLELVDVNALPVIRPGFDVNSLAENDDLSTGPIDTGFEINYFGTIHSAIYVNNNGNITFDANMMDFTPFGLTGNTGIPIIAPFFADVDTRAPDSNLVTYGQGTVDGHRAFGVNWVNVGYYNERVDKLNSFQLVLIERSDRGRGDFDIEFNYEIIEWETGDASGGVGGLGGDSARVGFSNGTGAPGTFYEFEGSGVNGAFLDDSITALIHGSRKSSVDGRYIFSVQNGLPELLLSVPVYVDKSCTLNGWDFNSDSNTWDPNYDDFNNISEDPDFIVVISEDPDFILRYLLRQVAAGQDTNSPCVDTGSDDANDPNIGLHTYTTRTDSVFDSGIVDMGFHYWPFTVTQYHLTVTALEFDGFTPTIIEPDPSTGFYDWYRMVPLKVASPPTGYDAFWVGTDNDSVTGRYNVVTMDSDREVIVTFRKNAYDLTVEVVGHGSVSPMSGTYDRGTVVELIATPDEGYRVGSWSDTDDDTSTATTNTVTMNVDRAVTVKFEEPRTIVVSGDITIQEAIQMAEDGDIIEIMPGTYYGAGLWVDKEITITGEKPDDPNIVSITVVDGNGYASTGMRFGSNAGRGTLLSGITFINCGIGSVGAEDGEDPGDPGDDGGGLSGGGIYCHVGSSPIIRNCIIRDCSVNGGDAANGADANESLPGGHGGWGGWARGGGVYVAAGSSPIFKNCTITNCVVTGGDGGDGGNYASGDDYYSIPGHGGNYSIFGLWQQWGYVGSYRYYSGYGGGVFCDQNSSPTFINCTITENRTQGGMSGIGGDNEYGIRARPVFRYEIPSYGGGVYCAANSVVEFIDCNIIDNVSPKPSLDPATGQPVYHLDPYLGHGGGIAFEEDASVTFTNCNISGNEASVGGGVYWADAIAEIFDCNVFGNMAYQGAGMFGNYGYAKIEKCLLHGNFAGAGPNDVDEVAGEGAGIYAASVAAEIIDSHFIDNDAATSGGGIFFGGVDVDSPILNNCLVVNNRAGRDGGGISVNWFAEPIITNCTIVGNVSTGDFGEVGNTGFGGGLYSSYESNSVVIDSIFWGNDASRWGSQIAVGTGFKFERRPSTVTVSYSDVQGMRFGVFIDQDCTLNWDFGNIGVDPNFVTGPLGDYYLSQTDTGDANQVTDSPCVDAGSDWASHLGMLAYTTRTDEVSDIAIVDMGYHYPFTTMMEPCRFCDLVYDGIIDFRDFVLFADNWLSEGCSDDNAWCNGTDITFDTEVDFYDLQAFAQCWLVQDTTAPVPNPAQWEIQPYPTSTTGSCSTGMTAETAVDAWGWDVEYYFECVSVGGHNSGWQTDPNYEDTGLVVDTEYGYRVIARDQLGNETDFSDVAYIVTSEEAADIMPPNPDPMTWAIEPNGISPNSIAMVATIATDESGVEYEFDCYSVGCHDSGWQTDPNYVDVNLAPDTTYSYRVRARDMSLRHNTTGWSSTEDANTFPAGVVPDITPPAPAPIIIVYPNAPPVSGEYKVGLDWWHRIVATATSTDASGVDYYIVVCLDDGFSSGPLDPITSPIIVGGFIIYEVDVDKYGGDHSPEHQWQVFVYDIYGNWASSQIVEIGGSPLF